MPWQPHLYVSKEDLMKNSLKAFACVLALGLASMDADAARRFGGGGNLGKQRPAPTMKEAPSAAPAAPAATKPGQPAPAATPAAPAAKPSFMQRWGGLLMGLGIGALLASMFGAQLGPIVGMLLMFLLLAAVGFMLYRFFAGRNGRVAPPGQKPLQFAGIGSAIEPPPPAVDSAVGAATAQSSSMRRPPIDIPDFEVEPFVRVAKTSFIRMQAANDAGDLDDIRDFTTPELYAEIAMQLRDRGDAKQKTEVVSLDAQVIEAVVEDDYAIASVRFWGLTRDEPGANPESFDEVWHVRKSLKDRKGSWLIAGIQQTEQAA
jgi:predicted lipid-binding transport protein (Tim44 family)